MQWFGVESRVKSQAPSVLLDRGSGVSSFAAAEQVQGGQSGDVGHTSVTSAEAMSEAV